jgi:hypothetical protein
MATSMPEPPGEALRPIRVAFAAFGDGVRRPFVRALWGGARLDYALISSLLPSQEERVMASTKGARIGDDLR